MAEDITLWHPEVHIRFQESLLYYLLRVRPFRKKKLTARLRAFLDSQGLAGYCFYQIYGTYDVLLRVWLPVGMEGQFVTELQKELHEVHQCNPFKVSSLPFYWCWNQKEQPDHAEQVQALDELTPETIDRVQRGEDAETKQNLISHGLLRQEARNKENIKVFIAIVLPHGIADEARADIADSIVQKMHAMKQAGAIDRTSVYTGFGFASFLVKCESRCYFTICELVNDLSEDLARNEGSTWTHLVANDDPLEKDLIGPATLKAMQTVDQAVNAILPELYVENALTDDEKLEMTMWARKHLLPLLTGGLSNAHLRLIRNCLLGVIKGDEDELTAQVMVTFSKHESFLRKQKGRAIGQLLGPEAEQEVLRAAGIGKEDRGKHLELGKILNIYSKIIEMADIQGTDDLRGGWNDVAKLRNDLAHGNFDNLLEGWDPMLVTFLDFLLRYERLRGIIEGVESKKEEDNGHDSNAGD